MGACYSISVKLKIKDGMEQNVVDALNAKIERAEKENVDYNINKHNPDFKAPYNLEELCATFFVEHQKMYGYTRQGNTIDIDSSFDASYGWEMVMIDAFEVMAPFLNDGSKMVIDTDDGVDRITLKDGKVIIK